MAVSFSFSCILQIWPSTRQLVRQDGGVTSPHAGRGRPGWPMAAHQLASAYKNCQTVGRPGRFAGSDRGPYLQSPLNTKAAQDSTRIRRGISAGAATGNRIIAPPPPDGGMARLDMA